MQASGLSHAGGVDGTWSPMFILDGLAGCAAGVALARAHAGTEGARQSLASAPASPPAAAAGGGGQPAGIRDAWLGALGRQRRASSDAGVPAGRGAQDRGQRCSDNPLVYFSDRFPPPRRAPCLAYGVLRSYP